jgi:phosphonate transport system substrate-binding protein
MLKLPWGKALTVLLLGVTILCGTVTSGTAGEKVRLAVTDIEGMEQLQREFGAMAGKLSELTGYELELFPVANRTAAVEAMRFKQVEFVLTGPAEYVVFESRTQSIPVVGFSRPDYFCTITVLADSGISSVADLRGKKVAMGDVGSTSKHLAPMQILKENGLDPRVDIEVVHTSIQLGWEALKRGDVAAFATTNDKFLKLRGKEKEFAAGAFRVIARGADLPNDLLIARQDLDQDMVTKVRKAFLDHSDVLIEEIMKGEDNQKFKGMKFLSGVKDADYNAIREMYRTIGHTRLASFVGE